MVEFISNSEPSSSSRRVSETLELTVELAVESGFNVWIKSYFEENSTKVSGKNIFC